ncbi:neuroguidin-like [Glandiceps talaboti]
MSKMAASTEIEKTMEEDIPCAISILRQLQHEVSNVTNHVQTLLQKVTQESISTKKGLGFLEVKYHLLLSYLMNLTYVMLRKVEGKSIMNETVVDRLIEIRTVLEKMKPIDHKLQYQIDKLVKIAASGQLQQSDPLRFQPNPDQLVSKLNEGDDDDDDDKKEQTRERKHYVPPKLVAMHYDEDDTTGEGQKKRIERMRKRALNSTFMRELRDEYLDAPEEIQEERSSRRMRKDVNYEHQKQYEEDHFVRLQVSKKDRKQKNKVTSLDRLTDFGEISALTRGEEDEPRKKKRKAVKGKKHRGKRRKY